MSEDKKYLVSDCDLGEDEALAVAEVVRGKWLSVGPRTAEFEAAFAVAMDVPHAVSVSNCTAGLHLALLAVGVGPGDEVLVPSFTFVASVNAVLYCQATPVYVDIAGPDDLNLAVDELEKKITPRTKAMVVVHMAGFPADMDRIMAVARRHHVKVVEDACHAIGATYEGAADSPYRGMKAGTIGDVGCFSFFANKNLVTGEGGMIVSRDESVAQYVRLGRSHGMTKTSWDKASGRASGYDVVQLGYNYRGTELTAALGLIQLRKLDANNAARRAAVAVYREALTAARLPLRVPFADRLQDSAHHIFPVVLDDASGVTPLREALTAAGVQTTHHYQPVHRFTHVAGYLPAAGQLVQTDDVAAREVTLPLHPLLTADDVVDIVGRLSRAFEQVAAEAASS